MRPAWIGGANFVGLFWFGSVDVREKPHPQESSEQMDLPTATGHFTWSKKKKNVARNLEKPIAVDEKFRIHVQKYTLNEYFSGCIGKSASEKQVLIATIKGNLYVYQTVRVAQQSTTYALSPSELMRTSDNTELIIPAVQKMPGN